MKHRHAIFRPRVLAPLAIAATFGLSAATVSAATVSAATPHTKAATTATPSAAPWYRPGSPNTRPPASTT